MSFSNKKMTSFSVITEGVVNVFVTSNCNSFTSEKRFPKDLTVELLKGKLELVTGASSLSMKISALDKNGRLVCNLDKDDAILGSYPVDSGMTLHVEDTNKHRDEFENTENVKKYEMTEEEYSKRTNTVQSFLRRNKLGKYNEEEVKKTEAKKQQAEAEDEEAAAKISVGDRCLVKASCCGTRRGCVKYVGKTDFKPGRYIDQLGRPTVMAGSDNCFAHVMSCVRPSSLFKI